MRKWFRGLRWKMMSLIGLSSVLIILLAAYSNWEMTQAGKKINYSNTVRIPVTLYTNAMAADLQSLGRALWAAYGEETPEAVKAAHERARASMAAFEKDEKALSHSEMSSSTRESIRNVTTHWPEIKATAEKIINETGKHTEAGDAAAKRLIIQELRPVMDRATEKIEEINASRMKMIEQETIEDTAHVDQAQLVLALVSIGSFLAMIILGFLMSSSVADVLTGVIQNLSSHSKEVSQASEGLSTAASSLSTGATETASSLEETVASTEELNSMVKTNADNAKQAAALAEEGRVNAENGGRNIAQLYEAVGQVSKSSKEIEQIISVIDDIAFQTNLLALNAAVEAARAGEQGKGFAVVAEAVRSLAQKSAEAAKDISRLIVDSVQKTESSRDLAEKSKESLARIVGSIRKISDINAEIATASNEQASGLTNISKAMNEIDRATQQNAASSEEISATSEEMTSQSVSLEKLVSDLVHLVEGVGQNALEFENQKSPSALRTSKAAENKKPPTAENVLPFQPRASKSSFQKKQADLEALLPLESSSSDRKISKVDGF